MAVNLQVTLITATDLTIRSPTAEVTSLYSAKYPLVTTTTDQTANSGATNSGPMHNATREMAEDSNAPTAASTLTSVVILLPRHSLGHL